MLTPTDMPLLRRRLLAWYEAHRRPLPWRKARDPYRIWVSEVMLQQTQVRTVLPYYARFLKQFPHVRQLAAADLQSVLKAWEGLGYYARARNLHRAAAVVAAAHHGRVPATWGEFRRLPGVGDYIAAAVLSIAFNHPHAVVDGNVKRVLARLLTAAAPVNSPAAAKLFQETANRLLHRRRPGDFNQAMMELGALICTPRLPACGRCPLGRFCAAHHAGAEHLYPRKTAGRTVPEVAIAVGVIFRAGRILITQRQPEGLLGGLWEFPGGKIQNGEAPEAACVREIREEVNLDVTVEERLAQVRHAYSHFRVVMDVFVCRHRSGRVRLNGPAAARWIRVDEVDDFPFPKANHKCFPLLKRRVSGRRGRPGKDGGP
jgi:A/G-specific adenine glycosylase